jgi:DNA topoisomerase-3
MVGFLEEAALLSCFSLAFFSPCAMICLMFILTEKPSVAKDIAAGLGGFTRDRSGFWTDGAGGCIVPAAGHLLALKMPEEYDERYAGRWELSQLPIAPT